VLRQHTWSAFATIVRGTTVENATEETCNASPRGCENGEAGCHHGNDALKQDASAARIEIRSRIRHAGDCEIHQRETKQEILHGAIHPRIIRVTTRTVNESFGRDSGILFNLISAPDFGRYWQCRPTICSQSGDLHFSKLLR
jgi:hypothetical protein